MAARWRSSVGSGRLGVVACLWQAAADRFVLALTTGIRRSAPAQQWSESAYLTPAAWLRPCCHDGPDDEVLGLVVPGYCWMWPLVGGLLLVRVV